VSGPADIDGVSSSMQVLYDRYFQSRDYQQRYPRPNASTLQCVLELVASRALRVVDVGAGNGRYTVELLRSTPAHVTASDISGEALAELSLRLGEEALDASRIQLVHGPVEVLPLENYDLVLLLFGVLSHAGQRSQRVALLQQLASRAHSGTRLVLSVPSVWRRRPFEMLRALASRIWKNRRALELGDIWFSRIIDGSRADFFYHLYSLSQLKTELADAGWALVKAEPESLLPEWVISQSPWMERLDLRVQKILPAPLGYGIRVVAVPL
jgi:SAM-dependent methyltransferase